MSNTEIAKSMAKDIVGHENTARVVGGGLLKVGAAGAGLWLLAGALPFVTFPMLLVLVVLLGGYLRLKS